MDKLTLAPALKRSPQGSVRARHVCAEGCQLVTGTEQLSKGDRFAFLLNASDRVTGTVRWVVRDRAGFAFDAPIADEVMAALKQNYRGIELYQD